VAGTHLVTSAGSPLAGRQLTAARAPDEQVY